MINAPIHPIPPRKGAAVEWWMYQVSQRLTAYEPHIVCIAADGQTIEEQRDGVFFHRIRIGRVYRRLFQKITRLDPWSYAHRAARLIDRVGPVIVHVHNAPRLLARLRQLCRAPGVAFAHHLHNDIALPTGEDRARLSACSRYLADIYTRRYPAAQVEVVTNGVDTQAYRPRWEQDREVAALKHKLGIAADRTVVLFVGRISPEKGPLDLVRAFEILRTRRPNALLLLVGEYRTSGKPGDRRADYGRQVVDACQRLGTDCILTGVVEPGDVRRYYWLGDVLVVPSEFEEPFGMVAIEAMAAGVPVLATRRGGLPEFVLPSRTGYLIDNAKDPIGLAAQIYTVLSNPDDMKRIALSARTYVEINHDWSTVALQLESFYARLLKA